ncbi:cytoplasmic dynein 1 light intermediate chain 2 [Parasteatoda tepidariorum]|nr:cytoplasmic dynein 1 light intermediate chain 2 [Parasteatoda tepidariorum]
MVFLDGKQAADAKSAESSNEEEENLWIDILNQVQESSPNKLPSCKSLLVLGDNESGKTSLIAKLEGNEDARKSGSGLEYHYLFVRDEYRDDHTRLGVWVLDGDPWHRNLLKYVLNQDTFPHTTVIITASMSKPWDILESLQNWAQIIEEHVQRLRLPQEFLAEQRKRVLKRFCEYTEPGNEILDGVSTPVRPVQPQGEDIIFDEEIKTNLGLEIIVVITKSDYMSTLQKEFDFREEHFDYIQLAIRNFCKEYGAALFYVSVKEDKNIDLFLKYLVHRIYSFPFRTPALVVEKDAVFIPSGWDNEGKINILVDNLSSIKADDPYHEVIVKPVNRKPLQKEVEVAAEEDEAFLCRLQNLLNQQVPSNIGRPAVGNQETPIRAPAGIQKTADRRLSGSPGVQASPKKIEGKPGTVGGEGVLQNFFNSLLNRRTGTPIGGPLASVRTPGDKVTVRHDAAAELDRMSGKSRKDSSLSQGSESSFGEDSLNDSSNSPQS